MEDPYSDREQTKAKHFILKSYLQALAFKIFTFSDIAYVDGFSGPWKSRTDDFSDSSFMIAISALQDAQNRYQERTGIRRHIRCFFSENNPVAFAQLQQAVSSFNRPKEGFEIRTYAGQFEDAVDIIRSFVGTSFPLIFIDPTGWKGYPFDKIGSLFSQTKCEVLINFMYDFINRFAYSDDREIVASLGPILGGLDWPQRLDSTLPRGPAVEKLFRETLKAAGDFTYVISTRIDKPMADRPYFFLAYGTKSADGLKTFRQIEYDALRNYAKDRAAASERRREQKLKTSDMFAEHEAELKEATIDEIVSEQKELATTRLLEILPRFEPAKFSKIVTGMLQAYMLRETNVKDICVELAKLGKIENTWGGGNRKPRDEDFIQLSKKQ